MRADEPYPHPTSAAVTASMKGNRRVNTRPEAALRSGLHRSGLRFRKDYAINTASGAVRADVVFTRQRITVFVDGCYWHLCPDHGRIPGGTNTDYWRRKLTGNAARDRRNTELLQGCGWTVIRIWEHVALDEAIGVVRRAVARHRAS